MDIKYKLNHTILPLELETCLDPEHIVLSNLEFVDSLENHFTATIFFKIEES